MKVYIVLGTKENVDQKDIVKVFSDGQQARLFVSNNKPANSEIQPYGDTVYYDLEIKSWEVE